MLITPAFAQTATNVATDTAAAGGGITTTLTSMLPVFLILAVFYMLVLRPQNKRVQEHRAMVGNLQRGDKVVTGGGLIATVKKTVNDDEVVLELADGVEVHALRSTIMAKRA